MEYSKQDTPLQCEREPIHIVNRIQPCGTLLVVDSDLRVVQCSANAVNMLPRDYAFNLDEEVAVPNGPTAEAMGLDPRLDSIIGNDLSLLLQPEAVEQIASLVSIFSTGRQSGTHHQRKTSVIRDSRRFSQSENNSDSRPGGRRFSHTDSLASSFSSLLGSVDEPEGVQFTNSGDAARNFLIRSKGTSTMNAEKRSCSVTQSGEFFLLELEDLHLGLDDDSIPNWGKFNGAENDGEEEDTAMTVIEDLGDRDVMLFMEGIAKELRQCWSIEEMASLVCSRIMAETPYDRGMVYRFDPGDDSGEVIYESFRRDARQICRKDPWLGLRFPASDIPRQARELFMRNTLRYIYDVNGNDWPLYPSKTRGSKVGGDPRYTDLSMCRLRGSSYVHLEYLRNMQVTSSLTIAIIVNKRLWGLYSFHGYREPIMPNARTRFLCEMASIMTSMVMESLTKVEEHRRLMDMERTMVQLHSKYPSMTEFMEVNYEVLMNLLDINMISFRIHRPVRNIHSFQMGKPSTSEKVEDGKNGDSFERGGILSDEVFDCLYDTYGQVCRDYGTVFIDEQKSHPTLVAAGLHTLAFFHLKGIDVVLSRQAVVEKVQWGGDPDKKLEPNGTLTPRNSFAAYVKGHLKKGKPWDEADKTIISRLAEQIEKYRTNEVFAEQTEAIQTLTEQKQQALEESRSNFDFFALMAHELRTPFHGILGSLEAMREDPALANNEMLRTAELCGKNMIKILDDILLVAKGSYSLKLEEQSVDVLDFLRQTIADMTSYAYMEGVSIRVRKEDVYHSWLYSDFSRIRQVVHNFISNAIKFSDRSDISIEILERGTFTDVLSVWKTYMSRYPACSPSLKDLAANAVEGAPDTLWLIISVIDKGIGISAGDLQKLGTAFTQLSQGYQKKYQGTGLGINICQMIVAALMGKLVIFSAKDYGSCFTFAVPVKKMVAKAENKEDNSVTTLSAKDLKKFKTEKLQAEYKSLGLVDRNPKPTIMVVDDSSINRKLCRRKIKTWLPDVNIVECDSGRALIDEYEHDYPIIMGVFLDFHMHGMDGDLATRRIREFEGTHEDTRRVYIVGYTADVLEDSTQKLLAAGMDSVIPKPESPYAFETELRNMMQHFATTYGDNVNLELVAQEK